MSLTEYLIDAVQQGNLERLKELTARAVKENIILSEVKNVKTYTLLELAACKGYLEIVKYLVEEVKISPQGENKLRYTPLHWAAVKGHLEIVKYLIEKANVPADEKNKYGYGPLHYASTWGQLDVVKYLIKEANVSPNVKNEFGETPAHAAAGTGYLEIFKYLTDREGGCISPNVKTNNGMTPLHSAAKGGRLEMVKYLIEEQKIPANEKDKYDRTPLYYASLCGKKGYFGDKIAPKEEYGSIVKYLIEEKKILPDVRNSKQIKRILQLATKIHDYKIFKFLALEVQQSKRNIRTALVVLGAIFLTPISLLFTIPLWIWVKNKEPIQKLASSQKEYEEIKIKRKACREATALTFKQDSEKNNHTDKYKKVIISKDSPPKEYFIIGDRVQIARLKFFANHDKSYLERNSQEIQTWLINSKKESQKIMDIQTSSLWGECSSNCVSIKLSQL